MKQRLSIPERRKKLQEQMDTMRKREAELAQKESSERRRFDNHRKIVIGAFVIAHAAKDAEFNKHLQAGLKVAMTAEKTKERDKATVQDWMSETRAQAS